jgi:hypothetical protein
MLDTRENRSVAGPYLTPVDEALRFLQHREASLRDRRR